MSEIRATTISDAAGTGPITLTGQSAAKAWLNYNHSGSAVKDSFNIASVTDTGTGDHRPIFTSSMANADYSITCTTKDDSGINAQWTYTAETTTGFVYYSADDTGSGYSWRDYPSNSSTIHGDLA